MEELCVSASAFLNPNASLRQACEDALVRLYSQVCECLPQTRLVADRLHTAGLGFEDVWQQLELLNEAALRKLARDARRRDETSEGLIPKQLVVLDNHQETPPSDGELETREDDVIEQSAGSESESSAGSLLEENTRGSRVDDKFLKLSEMEDFVNQVEQEGMKDAMLVENL